MGSNAGDSRLHRQDEVLLSRLPSLRMIIDTPKGRGIFANERIPAGTIIDTCPVLVLSPQENREHVAKTALYHYTYNWPPTPAPAKNATTQATHTQAIVFGLGSLFNHATRNQNVGWTRDVVRQVITYRALRDIRAGEELCISYGNQLTFADADADGDSEPENEDADTVLARIEVDDG